MAISETMVENIVKSWNYSSIRWPLALIGQTNAKAMITEYSKKKTSMSVVIGLVGRKCTLAASGAAPW